MPDGPPRDLIAGILQLANLLTRRLAPLFERAHVTPQQWVVLLALADSASPLTLAGLARRLMVSKQNMTGMMARLEQLGFAERRGDPADLRASRVQLSRRGRALVEKVRPAYERWRDALGSQLPERDITDVTRTVDRLIDELQQER